MKYTLILALLLSVYAPVQGHYTELAQKKNEEASLKEDDSPDAQAKKIDSPEEKKNQLALKSIDDATKTSEEQLKLAEEALNKASKDESDKLELALETLNVTNSQIDTIAGETGFDDP